jgi:hypothetical protein
MIPMTIRFAGAAMAACLMLAPAAPAAAQQFSAPQKTEIEQIVRDYLVSHPEVLQEAIAELDKRQAAADTEKARAARSCLAIPRATSRWWNSSITTALFASAPSRT